MTQPQRHAGFSLLEILVAFTIMAFALTVLLRIFGNNVQLAAVANDYSKATLLAESLLANVTAQTEMEEQAGEFDDRFRWAVTVSDYSMDEGEIDWSEVKFKLLLVEATVQWPVGKGQRQLTLSTLRLQPNEE